MKQGFDLEMLSAVCDAVDVPVIGLRRRGVHRPLQDPLPHPSQGDAGLAASIFHFGEVSIPDLKQQLAADGINMRL